MASKDMGKKGLRSPSRVEKVAGSLLTESTATLIAAFFGTPVAALLPVLTNSLASGRHKQRVERAIEEINEILESQGEALRNLSDEQYKLVNEAILTVFYTTEERKLQYLREVIRNGMTMRDIVPQESAVLARVIRDISAEEADFLIRNFAYKRIEIADVGSQNRSDVLTVKSDTRDGLIASGLIALGLLLPGDPTWDDSDLYRFSKVVAKLLVLLRGPITDAAASKEEHIPGTNEKQTELGKSAEGE